MTRPSSSTDQVVSESPFTSIVLNLSSSKTRPRSETRFWRSSTGPGLDIRTARAAVRKTGEDTVRRIEAPARSRSRFARHVEARKADRRNRMTRIPHRSSVSGPTGAAPSSKKRGITWTSTESR